MSNKNFIYCWDIQRLAELTKNQSVNITKDNEYVKVSPNQTTSTPGVKISKKFSIKKDKVYVLEVNSYVTRKESAFLWAIDSRNKRLIENYTFIECINNCHNTCSGFKLNYDTEIQIGVLFTNPKQTDSVFIKNIKLYEVDEKCLNIKNNIDIKAETKNDCPLSNTQDVSTTNKCNNNNQYLQIPRGCPFYKNNGHLNIYNNYSFCKIFDLPVCEHPKSKLIDFVETSSSNYDIKYNHNIPSGYTFLGQFISHDMSFNLEKYIIKKCNLDNNNYRSPHFDLDCLYGSKDNKYLYSNNKFIINRKHDLNRNKDGVAIIPDSRNDENYIIAQLHLLFQLFHNKLINLYKNKNINNLFEFVKKEVTFYYQWIIVNDYLPKLVDNNILDSIFKNGTKFYDSKKFKNCIPTEFSVAAFRTSHFTVRNDYIIANNKIMEECDIHRYTNGTLPEDIINWGNFFHVCGDKIPQPSKTFDTQIALNLQDMVHLPAPKDFIYCKNNLLLRNLLRSQQADIPSGQSISKKMGLNCIPIELLAKYDVNSAMNKNGMIYNTPLLLYILKESEIYKNGEQLTGIGGIIVAEVILSLLFNDPNSYFNSKEKWCPTISSKEEGQFLMGDLVRFVYS